MNEDRPQIGISGVRNGQLAMGRERILAAMEMSRDAMAGDTFARSAECRALQALVRAGGETPGTLPWMQQIVETILAAGIGGGQLAGLKRSAAAVAASMQEDAECRGRVELWWQEMRKVAT